LPIKAISICRDDGRIKREKMAVYFIFALTRSGSFKGTKFGV